MEVIDKSTQKETQKEALSKQDSRTPTSAPPPSPAVLQAKEEREHLKRFGEAIDVVRRRMKSEIGEEDVRYIHKINQFSRGMEIGGRSLIHLSSGPLTFSTGVVMLWIYKQLQTVEIGHTALHGTYDKLEGAEQFHSKTFTWEIPIDEASWHTGHNIKHHQYTNIAKKDPDINFGSIRLTEQTPHRFGHYLQIPATFLLSWPFFGIVMNAHFTGLLDIYGASGWRDEFDVIKRKDWASIKKVHKHAFRKYTKHALKEYVFFPALAGPMFWKVALGNFLSSRMRDVYSAATIYCGHVGADVASYPEGSKAKGRGQWYKMQIEASNNFQVAWPFNILCGGLEQQIEHHMFPKFPPQRLREVAPEIEAICSEYGVKYRNKSWGKTLWKAVKHIAKLSLPAKNPISAVRKVAREMT